MSVRVPPHRSHYRVLWPAALAATVLLLGGCTADGGGDSGNDGASSATSTGAAESAKTGASGAAATARAADLRQRKVERRGSLTLTSKDLGATRRTLVAALERVDGYVADERSRSAKDGALSRVDLTLVVPTDRFESAMSHFAAAGGLKSQQQTTKDVTAQVVDVQSRVASAHASLRRVRLLLGRAEKLDDVIRLESVLAERQADLEALLAQQKSLASSTATATVEVSVRPRAHAADPVADDTGFLAGLSTGWSSLRSTWDVLTTAVGAALPLGVALGAPVAGLIWLIRRASRRGVTARG